MVIVIVGKGCLELESADRSSSSGEAGATGLTGVASGAAVALNIFNMAGRLAGAAAHDFNNILTGVLGNLELMQRRADRLGVADFNDYLSGARSAAARGVGFAQSLLTVAGHQSLEPSVLPSFAFFQAVPQTLAASLGGTTSLQVACAADMPSLFCDEAQLSNALCELGRNAVKSGADRLTVSAALQPLNDIEAAHHGLKAGTYITITMQDNGAGMSDEIAAHALEPFFSTSGAAGLGLSKVLGFARQSGGHAFIASHQPGNTIITLLLPAADAGG